MDKETEFLVGKKTTFKSKTFDKKVAMISLDGIVEETFSSASHAAKVLGYDKSTIHAVCRGRKNQKTYKGKIWKFVKDVVKDLEKENCSNKD